MLSCGDPPAGCIKAALHVPVREWTQAWKHAECIYSANVPVREWTQAWKHAECIYSANVPVREWTQAWKHAGASIVLTLEAPVVSQKKTFKLLHHGRQNIH